MVTIDPKAAAAAKRQKAAELRRQAELLDAEANGIECAVRWMSADATDTALPAVVRPTPEVVARFALNPTHQRGRGGRQKGAISHPWRRILVDLQSGHPEGFSEADVVQAAALQGIALRPKDARDRMHSYAAPDIGYVEVTGTGFRVTDLVLTKFSPHQ